MLTGTELASDDRAESNGRRTNGRASAKLWVAAGLAGIALVAAGLKYSPGAHDSSADTRPAALPQVVVSRPLVQDLDTRLGFLGQFSAVSQVELRAQVGGTLTGIFFKDGDIVPKGDLLFTIDPRPYEITLAEATAQLDVATARLELADQQLDRAKDLEQSNAGSVENVDQRTSDQRAARAVGRRREGPNPRCAVRPRPLPDHGAVHWAHWDASCFRGQSDCWQSHGDESDDIARDACVA